MRTGDRTKLGADVYSRRARFLAVAARSGRLRIHPGLYGNSRDRGMAAIAVITLMLLLSLVVMGMVHGTARDQSLTVSRVETIQAFYAAEAGMNMAIRELSEDTDEDGDGTVGTISDDSDDATDPVLGGGRVMVTASESGGQYTLTSQGRSGASRREAVSLVSPAGGRLLFVVSDAGSPPADDLVRKSQFETWGYIVTMISDDDSQANYDVAAAQSDVVYISETTASYTLGTKITSASIGIVSEESRLNDELGISSDEEVPSTDQIEITNNSHYITSGFSTGALTVTNSTTNLNSYRGTLAGGIQVLADEVGGNNDAMLVVIDTGGALYGGGNAAERRVMLPWCQTSSNDFGDLTADGLTITRRALDWAAGNESGGGMGLIIHSWQEVEP